ncbi:MAG: hypothetical protein COV10_04005 [Candidatus Vogelbacteria bacterium CG10_big_fil_rev_8_21_14_0_10_51_16]|uniref:DNA-directed DNA polymerase n=1 Tax=Candidatus Vogelbacteria bacterium CG10_big_fil_rev_8_21_14_0_10_51_16 TaxID=1975045 RepID=A0A2H0RDM6_9BACT|nr:MAG: hypothetical protein COV10_04005 [Candidatus Vogelbacteria bacterium CG10_big_fil_rev_8_21_14_0_10_51_16]
MDTKTQKKNIPATSYQLPATKRIVLLDTHAILHRAYHSMPEFTSSTGEPTGALYGLAVMLISIIKSFQPISIVACYDLPEATFRHREYEGYKAKRAKVDEALISQIVASPAIFEAFGIPVVSAPGFEADDMLGTIVEQLSQGGTKHEARGTKIFAPPKNYKLKTTNSKEDSSAICHLPSANYQIIIASGDMDTLQLVDDDKVVVYTLRKGIKDTVLYSEEEVFKRFGFSPKLLPDFKGLRGDPSDNIIGVPGIGEKTATELIVQFGSLERLYDELEKHKSQTAQKPNKAPTPRKAVVGIPTESVRTQSQKTESRNECSICHPRHSPQAMSGSRPPALGLPSQTLASSDVWIPTASVGAAICSLGGLKPRVVELLLAHKDEAFFSKMLATIRRDAPITFNLEEHLFAEQFTSEKVRPLFEKLGFKSLLPRLAELKLSEDKALVSNGATGSSPSPRKGNASDEKKNEKQLSLGDEDGDGVKSLIPKVEEAHLERLKLAYWLLDPGHHELSKEAIFAHTGAKTVTEAEEKLRGELSRNGLMLVYDEIELPLIPLLTEAKARGILIDPQHLAHLSREYHVVLARLEKSIWKEAGEEFNINSPKQLGSIVFEKLELGGKKVKRTATGQVSTKVTELEKLKGEHPIIDAIMEYREYQKLLSTYLDAIPPLLDSENRLHSTMVQTGAATGRMSSIEPNLQNIPIKTELGRAMRSAFLASPGHLLVAFDYSQIDLRVAAMLSGDPQFLQIFKEGIDVHLGVASAVFNVAPEQVDREMRRRAKVINFGILYGMGVNALKQNLGTERAEAEEFYQAYFERFPGLRAYLDKVKAEAHATGYTRTYFGRRRYYPKIRSKLPYVRSMEERMAMNAPIQGTTADIIKIAMGRVPEALQKAKLEKSVHLLLQVHDELIYEVEADKVDVAVPVIRQVMEGVITEPISFPVHVSVGENWGGLEDYGK